jgi:putative membrane protein
MMGFGMFGMIFFWIVLIALVVLLVPGLFQVNGTKPTNKAPTARQILEQRYARGEITKEQYFSMLKDIQ